MVIYYERCYIKYWLIDYWHLSPDHFNTTVPLTKLLSEVFLKPYIHEFTVSYGNSLEHNWIQKVNWVCSLKGNGSPHSWWHGILFFECLADGTLSIWLHCLCLCSSNMICCTAVFHQVILQEISAVFRKGIVFIWCHAINTVHWLICGIVDN